MEKIKKKIELRGTKYSDFISYFKNKGYKAKEISSIECHFLLEELIIIVCDKGIYKIGTMSFPEVDINLSGDEEVIVKVIYDLRLEFLSAGG